MKNSTLVLGIIAAAAAAVSIYLGVQLAAANEQLAQEAQARSADEARIRQLEAERRRLEAALSTAHPATPGAPPTGTPPLPSKEPRFRDSYAKGGPAPEFSRAERPGGADNTPATQSSRRLQQEIRLRRVYADMPAALGLDAAQADKLFDLLADNQMAASTDARRYAGDPAGAQSLDAAAREQRDAAIEALLGPDKAAEFQSFEKTIPARMQVGRIGESMAASNVPLSEAQRNSLITAVAAEQEAAPPPQRPTEGNGDADYETRFLDWQADYSRRVQARIEPLLTSEQAARYREAVEAQNARRANQRARAAARQNAATTPN